MKEQSDGSSADYYKLPQGATQLQHLISYRNMNAQIGEIFRACYRYGLVSHSDMLRDAKKIKFYAEAEIERLEKLELAEKALQADNQKVVMVGGDPISKKRVDEVYGTTQLKPGCSDGELKLGSGYQLDVCKHPNVAPGAWCPFCKTFNMFNGDE